MLTWHHRCCSQSTTAWSVLRTGLRRAWRSTRATSGSGRTPSEHCCQGSPVGVAASPGNWLLRLRQTESSWEQSSNGHCGGAAAVLGPCRVHHTPCGPDPDPLCFLSWSLHRAAGVTCALGIPCRKEFEDAKTHDDLWNAAQREMTHLGKMHGFMRMYWAKCVSSGCHKPLSEPRTGS